MKCYYVIKKGGREYRLDTDSKAAIYEMWDCIGRGKVLIEKHFTDTDADGNEVWYKLTADKVTRRTLKSGEVKYSLHYIGQGGFR